ncbi:ABC transporter permease [Bradyrhizobium iriomotense]|uniref:Transport permease protein n=1 Tax=Bradyrhizobium iriomotense TaxID=441950 RepID=A0ABQ6AZQ7_9BRAD|nr:ABC transporter permease [Bradyrhizobium iriomotense]GLR87674.1 transport permease protein [Bradyrhizobium iriomotense]
MLTISQRPASLIALFRSLHGHGNLIRRLCSREFSQRFRGSMLGMAWAIIMPVFTAAIYTFVFSTVFKARWTETTGGPFDFAIIVLTGMVVHGVFAESIARAPSTVIGNANYVKKVVFPLEILPVVVVLSSLINACIGSAIVLTMNLVFKGMIFPTALLLPLVIGPYAIVVAALVFVLAAVGVYLRDLSQLVSVLITITLFLTPIFFPIEAVPEEFRSAMWLNPLTFIVQQVRDVVIFGRLPDFIGLSVYSLAGLSALAFSFWIFQRLRNGFADVL